MTKLRVHNVSMSLDGFAAGPDQTLEDPMGAGGKKVHNWLFATASGQRMIGGDPGDLEEGIDDEFFAAGVTGIGATIMGRNMFGPVRGPWGDSDWTGWWGPEPPFHHPVFVLTHHAHDPIEMVGTTFYFVTDGIESALAQATEAAGGEDIRLGGGASTVRQYLQAGLIDELHLPVAPVLLGRGERIFDGDPTALDGYECEIVTSPLVAHFRFTRA